MSDQEDYIVIGKISGVFGVKGWVKVFSDTDPRENIVTYSPWYLSVKGEWLPHTVEQGKRQGKTVIAKLKDCEDREAAALLTGQEIAIRRDQMDKLEEGEFYWSDLIGLQVETTDGQKLGKVSNLLETGANDVLIVNAEDKEILVPYIKDQVIKKIDLDEQLIVVDWDPDF